MPIVPGLCAACGGGGAPEEVTVVGTVDVEVVNAAPIPVSGTVEIVNDVGNPIPVSLPSVVRTPLNTLLTAGADRAIPAGRRSYSVVVAAMVTLGVSVTLDGVALPALGTYTYTADENNTLAAAQVNTTGAGDIVLVMELF